MGSNQSNEYSNETSFRQPRTYGFSYSTIDERLYQLNANTIIFYPANVTTLLFSMYGARVRYGHIVTGICVAGSCVTSQMLKGIGDVPSGSLVGMGGAAMYLIGAQLRIHHVYPLVPQRIHTSVCLISFCLHLRDYYNHTLVFEDASPDDPL